MSGQLLNNQEKEVTAEPSFTKEQKQILASAGNIRINAVAGSGKTTTIIEYAASRPPGSRILYLAFNKSVRQEASRRFAERGLNGVQVETAHSLAFRYIMRGSPYKVRAQSYKTHEIADLLGLTATGEKHAEYIIATHINRFVTYFCNSDAARVQELDYLSTITDSKARNFVKQFYPYIEQGTRQFLARMDKAAIEITHDFYLKKFQLSRPQLPFDYILFDEGQDASAAMLSIFMSQPACKVIVGDTHQQIYGWRHAVNSLALASFPTLQLSASFRFRQDIANLAMAVLDWKTRLGAYSPVAITGKGLLRSEKTKATIARTNLGLLLQAIAYITDNRKVKHIYFEGNINSYTYAEDGASLYDVLNLFNGRHDRIRDKLVGSMQTIEDLEEYIEKTEDQQLAMMVELVKEYGSEVHSIIQQLKDLHTGDADRDKAEMIFSTVHRAKGMEYDVVYLVDDFITSRKLDRLLAENAKNNQSADLGKLNEEINLLYVAVTRVRYRLHIPESLLPESVAASPHIVVEKNIAEPDRTKSALRGGRQGVAGWRSTGNASQPKGKTLAERQKTDKSAYQPWTAELDEELKDFCDRGASVGEMAEYFERTKGAIIARLKKLQYLPD